MALFYEARLFISDENGVAISGGKARFRDANTTDLTDLFSDAGLTTPLANPVVADGNGWTPQIFAAEGTICDVQYLTAGDVAIPSRNYVDVVALGDDTGLARTFTGGTRLQFSDSGGVVIMAVGDPSPDNVGGSLKVQGWSGTQGDGLTLNFAAVNAGTSSGALKENSKKLQGVVQTEATQVTAQTTFDIPLPNLPAGVTAYQVDIFDYSQSAIGNLLLRMSADGVTFSSGATDYNSQISTWDSGGSFASALTTASTFFLVSNLVGTTNKPGRLRLDIHTPNSGNDGTHIAFRGMGVGNTGAYVTAEAQGFGPSSLGRVTHIRLSVSAGNFTFKYRVVPLRGTGD